MRRGLSIYCLINGKSDFFSAPLPMEDIEKMTEACMKDLDDDDDDDDDLEDDEDLLVFFFLYRYLFLFCCQ